MKDWHFNKIDNCSDYKFNQTMTDFDKYGVAGLIRENIQNSCDAILNSEKPVIIKINLDEIKSDTIPGINTLKERINSLKGMNPYSKNFITHMKKTINKDMAKIITIEDLNTTGLSGATETKSPYVAYAYSKGFHAENEDSEKEAQRGGSHGIGKISLNAASDIFTMFFSTMDEKNKKYIGGTCEFIDHKFTNQNYRGTGIFAKFNKDKDMFEAYENLENNIFAKNSRGLKTIVPFLKKEFFDNKEIIKGACDSFFISILENKLIIQVKDTIIDKNSIKNFVLNNDYYIQDTKSYNKNSNLTPLYFKTFSKEKPLKIEIEDKYGETYNFNLFLSINKCLKIGKFSVFRTNGMKVSEKSIKGYSSSQFNIVLISNSIKEDIFLKSLENEAHTQLNVSSIKNDEIKKNAIRFINNLEGEISKIVSKKLELLNPTDGKIDTSDILYNLEHSFKEANNEKKSAIKIYKKENIKEELVIEKETTGSYDFDENGHLDMEEIINKKKNPKKHDHHSSLNKRLAKAKEPGNIKRKKIKKENNKEKVFTKLSNSIVKRKISENKEILSLDLSNSELKNENTCNLKISMIDGEGFEINDFNISENYNKIINKNNNLELSVDEKEIKHIPIEKGKINLIMICSKNYNKNLKFIYEVVI